MTDRAFSPDDAGLVALTVTSKPLPAFTRSGSLTTRRRAGLPLEKLAVTDLDSLIETSQAPVPEQAPVQPLNFEPDRAEAVKETL